jgi:hypothetical protein
MTEEKMTENLDKEIAAAHIITIDALSDILREVKVFCEGVSNTLSTLKISLRGLSESDEPGPAGTTGPVGNTGNEEKEVDAKS